MGKGTGSAAKQKQGQQGNKVSSAEVRPPLARKKRSGSGNGLTVVSDKYQKTDKCDDVVMKTSSTPTDGLQVNRHQLDRSRSSKVADAGVDQTTKVPTQKKTVVTPTTKPNDSRGVTAAGDGNKKASAQVVTVRTTPVAPAVASMKDEEHEAIMSQVIAKRKMIIKQFVKDSLFPKVKFLIGDDELGWDFEPFAGAIMSYMGVPLERRRQRWDDIKMDAKRSLNERRASVNAAVKTAVKGTHMWPC